MAETTDDRLRLLIERVERMEEEKKGIGDDIRDIYNEAKSAVHPIGCTCKVCTPAAATGRRPEVARAATRVLFVVAAVLSIPFIVAYALASAKGDVR